MSELDHLENRAVSEEQLAALYFIAAGVAFNAGWPIFGWLMAVKGMVDVLSSIAAWSRVFRAREADALLLARSTQGDQP